MFRLRSGLLAGIRRRDVLKPPALQISLGLDGFEKPVHCRQYWRLALAFEMQKMTHAMDIHTPHVLEALQPRNFFVRSNRTSNRLSAQEQDRAMNRREEALIIVGRYEPFEIVQ